MVRMFDLVEEKCFGVLVFVFVICDFVCDGFKELKEYFVEFYFKFIGLIGIYDQIKVMCKVYWVYFSMLNEVKLGQDYLVDYSIYFYFMDFEGDFVEVFGRQYFFD